MADSRKKSKGERKPKYDYRGEEFLSWWNRASEMGGLNEGLLLECRELLTLSGSACPLRSHTGLANEPPPCGGRLRFKPL